MTAWTLQLVITACRNVVIVRQYYYCSRPFVIVENLGDDARNMETSGRWQRLLQQECLLLNPIWEKLLSRIQNQRYGENSSNPSIPSLPIDDFLPIWKNRKCWAPWSTANMLIFIKLRWRCLTEVLQFTQENYQIQTKKNIDKLQWYLPIKNHFDIFVGEYIWNYWWNSKSEKKLNKYSLVNSTSISNVSIFQMELSMIISLSILYGK